jgi:hypothetical protein
MFLFSFCFYTVSTILFFVVGTMPPRKPTTRRSSRAPKMKESEVGEGSSQGIAKQLEYALRLEHVIKTKTRKVFIDPPAFGYTKERIRSKIVLPHWGDLFNKIIQEEYPEYVPHDDPRVRDLDDLVFSNI